MKANCLASLLAFKSVYAIYNQKAYDFTNDGFSVSWDSHDDGRDFFRLTVLDQANEVVSEVDIDTNSATFSDLAPYAQYNVQINSWNATSNEAIGGGNRVHALTGGSGAWITSHWGAGAQGYVMWDSEEGACGQAFNFMLPCDSIAMLDLGVGNNVGVEKSSNSSMSIFVGRKTHYSFIQWVAFGECDWDSYVPEDFVVESFDGYDQVEAEVEISHDGSWSQTPDHTTNNISFDYTDDQAQDCAPTWKLEIPCEVKLIQSWNSQIDEDSGVFDGTSTVFTGTADSDWIRHLGFIYEFADECVHDPVATVISSVRR